MKKLLKKRFNLILVAVISAVLVAAGVPMSVNTFGDKTSDFETETVVSSTEATAETESRENEETEPQTELSISSSIVKLKPQAGKSKESKNAEKKTAKKLTEKKPDAKKATEPSSTSAKKKSPKKGFSYATAPTVKNKASYDEQWNAGYLVAIDNPDRSFHPAHVELSDADRDLLERLCYGEFGNGGFTGAALIAQAVRDAMNTYGISSVKDVISGLHYTGRTNHPGGKTIKDAVVYIFDMDKSAVQHRIIYMYDTSYVDSFFHESQSYVCTFKTTRFFDKK